MNLASTIKLQPRLSRLVAVRWLWVPLLAFAISRALVVFAAYFGQILLNDATDPPPYHLFGSENVLLDVFASRWDTGFYLSIADEGYKYQDAPLPSVAFWPLLPLLMRAVGGLIGSTAIAGLLISNGALLIAAVLFYRLVAEEWSEPIAERAVWYMLIFPSALFGSAIYSESLWLCCAIGAFYMARRGWWESAAILAFAAALSRMTGVIVAPMLLLEWWRQRQSNAGQRPPLLAALAACGAPLGSAAYMFYLNVRFGDPLAFVHAAAAWERKASSPLIMLAELWQAPPQGWVAALQSGQFPLNNWIDFGFVVGFMLCGLILLYERRYPEASLVLLGVLIPFSSGLLMSQRRYMWVLFPVYVLLARWGERPWVDRLITVVAVLGLVLMSVLFANGYWVA